MSIGQTIRKYWPAPPPQPGLPRIAAKVLLSLAWWPVGPLVLQIFFNSLQAWAPTLIAAQWLMWALVGLGHAVGPIGWVVIWRREVRWTPRRIALTVAASLVPAAFLAGLYGVNTLLRPGSGAWLNLLSSLFSLSEPLTGILLPLIWWGLPRWAGTRLTAPASSGETLMRPILTRMLLSIVWFSAASALARVLAGLVGFAGLVSVISGQNQLHMWVVTILHPLLACIGWLGIWRSAVLWTPRRTRATWAVTGIALAAGVGYGVLTYLAVVSMAWPASMGIPLQTAGAFALALWALGAALVWAESPAERAERLSRPMDNTTAIRAPHCPACGYDLTGLRSTRCPECGQEYTLDDLLVRCLDQANPERTLLG